jgi:hypothetical protein
MTRSRAQDLKAASIRALALFAALGGLFAIVPGQAMTLRSSAAQVRSTPAVQAAAAVTDAVSAPKRTVRVVYAGYTPAK